MQINLKNGDNSIRIYVSDVRNVVVEITRIKKDGKKEVKKGYYHNLEYALKYVIDDFPYISRDKTVKDLQLFLDSMKQQLWSELEGLKFPSNEEALAQKETASKEVFDAEEDDWDDEEGIDEDWE